MSGGSTTTSNQLPAWYENAAQNIVKNSQSVAQRGYVPNMGPAVAALAPQQQQAMQMNSDWGAAFGLHPKQDVSAGIPPATDFGGGIKGYSSFPLFESNLAALKQKFPGLYNYIQRLTIDPVTGKPGAGAVQPAASMNGITSSFDQPVLDTHSSSFGTGYGGGRGNFMNKANW